MSHARDANDSKDCTIEYADVIPSMLTDMIKHSKHVTLSTYSMQSIGTLENHFPLTTYMYFSGAYRIYCF